MAPSHDDIAELFSQLSTPETQKNFFARVADNVNWWIVGSTPMSGTYTSKQAFTKATFDLLNSKVLDRPLNLRVRHIVAGGEYATAEMEAVDMTCKNGMVYNMRYCWVVRFGDDGMINTVRAYLDTDLLSRAMEQNK